MHLFVALSEACPLGQTCNLQTQCNRDYPVKDGLSASAKCCGGGEEQRRKSKERFTKFLAWLTTEETEGFAICHCALRSAMESGISLRKEERAREKGLISTRFSGNDKRMTQYRRRDKNQRLLPWYERYFGGIFTPSNGREDDDEKEDEGYRSSFSRKMGDRG